MHINKKKSLILPQATIYVFSVLYNVTRTKTGLDSTFDCVCVCHKGQCTQSNYQTLTLERTEGQTAFLLRSEHPFSHYAAALIYRNTKIRLNWAIFSFAFRGHFSCLENSSHSDGTRGSIVIMACSMRVQSLHSLAYAHRPQLQFSPHHSPSCVAMTQQQRQRSEVYCVIAWSVKERINHRWPISALGHNLSPVGNIGHFAEPTRPANTVWTAMSREQRLGVALLISDKTLLELAPGLCKNA